MGWRISGRSRQAVTKRDIVRSIAEQGDLSQTETLKLVQQTFDALVDALVREGRVELRNFGVFQIKHREARQARNPRTGEAVMVRARSVVTFKPGKEMEARVREFSKKAARKAAKKKRAAPEASPPPAKPGSGETVGE
jgi:DNA-binding protein HU-beta/integration host factor subunit beta